jgi:hypothetical protein
MPKRNSRSGVPRGTLLGQAAALHLNVRLGFYKVGSAQSISLETYSNDCIYVLIHLPERNKAT